MPEDYKTCLRWSDRFDAHLLEQKGRHVVICQGVDVLDLIVVAEHPAQLHKFSPVADNKDHPFGLSCSMFDQALRLQCLTQLHINAR